MAVIHKKLKKFKKRTIKFFKKRSFVIPLLTIALIFVFALHIFDFGKFGNDFGASNQHPIVELAFPLEHDVLLDEIYKAVNDKRFILLGEASHGTEEFYYWRSVITKHLIEENVISFVAVEGDWDALYQVNLYVKGLSDKNNAREILESFSRWPEWMWSNYVFLDLVEWIRDYNSNLDFDEMVGVYGVDVYGADNSLNELMIYYYNLDSFFENIDYSIFESDLENLINCFSNFEYDFMSYASFVSSSNSCEDYSIKFHESLDSLNYNNFNDYEEKLNMFNLIQSSIVVKNAESHYRNMRLPDSSSWNARAESFGESTIAISEFYKSYSDVYSGVVWAHNTHVGDAEYASMLERGSTNIGHYLRNIHSDDVFIVGFGTYSGTVVAGREWGVNPEIMNIPSAPSNSYEYLFNSLGFNEVFFMFNEYDFDDIFVHMGNRAIGVVYTPVFDNMRNFVQTTIQKRYDAFIFINNTNALEFI